MDDEVDWSSSPINSPILRAADTHGSPMGYEVPELSFQEDYKYPNADQESTELPVGEPYNPYLNSNLQFKPVVSRRQRAEIGVHVNRRKPSRDDYSNFVLYQASQKVYEATFLTKFVAHALHPGQFDACFSTGHDSLESIRQYVKSVSDNVDQLSKKMIWNTHSRTVRFMANDEKETTPFWDFQQFDNQVIADFTPGNTFPVPGLMNQSWHKAFNQPSMVRYNAKQYQVGPDTSPFEEIDDVTGHTKLFEDKSVAYTASHNRVVRSPRTKKPKNQHLPGAILRENLTTPRNYWLQGLLHHRSPSNSISAEGDGDPVAMYNTSQDVPPPEDISVNHMGNNNSVRTSDVPTATSVCTVYSPAEKPICLERLVASHGSDVLLKESGSSFLSEDMSSQYSDHRPFWRKMLIQDHKHRLAQRWPQSQQPRDAPSDFGSCVDRAIKNGDLRPLALGLRRIADFVELPRSALPSNETQLGSENDIQSYQPEHNSNEVRAAQADPGMQPDIETRSSAADSAHSTRRNSQVTMKKRDKRQKRDPKAKKSGNPKNSKISKTTSELSSENSSFSSVPAQIHPNLKTSKVLEDDQQLPPDAYFAKITDEEKPAWRCGIKHPMGHYYNAGDRKNCPGCFTAYDMNPKKVMMDFYLPSRSHFFQPAPEVIWKPGRPTGKPRRSGHLSHNSIAKDAYWESINAGTTTDEALRKGIEAVEEHLRAKQDKKEKKEPTPEPTPEPVDMSPHPSGSKTMEHGQNLPVGTYWKKQARYDEFAWRCDVNHALGRYYLAGDVRSCPGCGSSRFGPGQHPEMDFYLPSGSVARQEAPGLVKYKPRKAYKLTKKSKKAKQIVTHNQFCSKKYWEFIEEGHEYVEGGATEEALALAIKATDAYVDAKVAAMQAKLEDSGSSEGEQPETKSRAKRKRSPKQKRHQSESDSPARRDQVGARLFSFDSTAPIVPRKRGIEEINDSDLDEVTEYESAEGDEEAPQETTLLSSDDESTSDSDSE